MGCDLSHDLLILFLSTFLSTLHSLCEEFPFKCPGVTVDIQYFAEPMERVTSNFCEGPFGRCYLRAHSDLNYVFAAPASDLVFPMVMNRVSADDSPGLDRRVPNAQRRAEHVLRFVHERASIRTIRHNPDVLNSSAF